LRDAAGYLAGDRRRPERPLVPGKQIAREPEPKREHKQKHAAEPIQFPGWLESSMDEHTQHMCHNHDDHAVGRPVVNGPDGGSEPDFVLDK
jgi:hypothetical protein